MRSFDVADEGEQNASHGPLERREVREDHGFGYRSNTHSNFTHTQRYDIV